MRDVGCLSWGVMLLLSSVVDAFIVFPDRNKNNGWTFLKQEVRAPVQPIKVDGSPSKICSSIQLNEVLATAALLFVTTMTTPVTVHIQQPSNHIAIQLSSASALTEQQVLVDDVWREVTRQFVDKTYNGLGEDGWRQKCLEAVKKVANVGPDDTEVVYSTIRTMLNALGDPYTRFLAPDQYESLTAYARGGTSSSAGIGVQLLLDPASGGVVVLSTVQTGPAAKAGVMPGDVIVEVDGMDVQSATPEVVAAKCRGDVGSTVTLTIRHGSSSSSNPSLSSKTTLALTRAEIKVSGVESSTFVSDKGQKVGLIKLSSFNQETASQVMEALKDVKSHGASCIVIDLRGNAGGYMPAGVDVAKLFLPPQSRVISEVDRSDRATIYTADGIGSDTTDPLYLIVDERTASASEILTAALQDNHRAIVVGPRKTFGKGRIQNVQGLEDGSGIAVTKAKYITPSGRDIHGIGILPDIVAKDCELNTAAEVCLTGSGVASIV